MVAMVLIDGYLVRLNYVQVLVLYCEANNITD